MLSTILGHIRWIMHYASHISSTSVIFYVSYGEDPIRNVSVGWVLKGLPSLHSTFRLLRNTSCADMGSLLQSVRQWQGQLKCLQQRFTCNVAKIVQVGVLWRMCQTMSAASKLADCVLYLFGLGLAWHKIGIYHSAITAFFWNLIIITRIEIIPSSLC